MNVSIIVICLCIFNFTASLASPSPQSSNDPCVCRYPNSEICKRRQKQNGCSGSGGFGVTESAFASTSTGK